MSQLTTARIALDGPTIAGPLHDRWNPATIDLEPSRLVGLLDWTRTHLHTVRALLADVGAVRLRGARVNGASFGQMVSLIADAPLLEYTNRSTPRTRVEGKIFTSTEYRADQTIHLHSEQSYATTWPAVLGFWCPTPAASGGQTPLASTAQILQLLPDDLVARFEAHGVRYDRWFRPGLDVSWAETYQTSDPREVDELCSQAGITTEWHDNDTVLHTIQIAQATHTLPTRNRVWFNQANLFHPAALPDDVAAAVRALPPDHLPRNASFGDGTAIDDMDIETINRAMTACSWVEPWGTDDVVLVDNAAVAHGRRSFKGTREVRVAMAGT